MKPTTEKIFKTYVPYEYLYAAVRKRNGEVYFLTDKEMLNYINNGKTIGESIDAVSEVRSYPSVTQHELKKQYKYIIKSYISSYNSFKETQKHTLKST